jgi:vancomycin resistance protein VanJ
MKLLKFIGNGILLLIGAYGGIIAAFLLLRITIGEQWAIVSLFNHWLPSLYFISLILLVITLIFRRWRVMITQLPALLAFIITYASLVIPVSKPIAGATQFTLLTYNVMAQNLEWSRMEDVMRAVDADIVLVQELILEAAEYLEPALADLYPYSALHTDVEQGVFSRYPLLEDTHWRSYHGNYQRVVFEVEGERVVLYNVHPYPPFWWSRNRLDPRLHRAEIDDLLSRAAQETDAVILAGDFNMSDQSEDYALVHASYDDAFRVVGIGFGLTIPANFPTARADYVFYNSAIAPVDAVLWSDVGNSDHVPVWVQLSFAP